MTEKRSKEFYYELAASMQRSGATWQEVDTAMHAISIAASGAHLEGSPTDATFSEVGLYVDAVESAGIVWNRFAVGLGVNLTIRLCRALASIPASARAEAGAPNTPVGARVSERDNFATGVAELDRLLECTYWIKDTEGCADAFIEWNDALNEVRALLDPAVPVAWKTSHKAVCVPITEDRAVADGWRAYGWPVIALTASRAPGLNDAPVDSARYETLPGESLMGIALRQLKDESRWTEIRDLNADRFPDMGPHDYYPLGTALLLPTLARPE